MQPDSRIFVAGHRGMVGSAIVRRLQASGYSRLIVRDRSELDLARQREVEDFFRAERPEYVFLAAAKVGGIHANSTYPADFIRDNLAIQSNVIDSAWREGARRLLFLGSSCIYPKFAPQPIREESLLTGALEPTNEAYAIAKIAGLKMCEAYKRQFGFDAISAMPTNLYGPGDNYHPENAHVVPALIRRFHEARLQGANHVSVWGTGRPLRELLFVDDLADALILMMHSYEGFPPLNIGSGDELSIAAIAGEVAATVGFEGEIAFDASRPDGTPRKVLDSSRIRALGWKPSKSLRAGLAVTYQDFVERYGR